jgi:hypothetical protein
MHKSNLPLSPDAREIVLLDLVSIVQGEELDIPWRRVRILLDHRFAEIRHPVIAQGSNTSLDLTAAGLKFVDEACTQYEVQERPDAQSGNQATRRRQWHCQPEAAGSDRSR